MVKKSVNYVFNAQLSAESVGIIFCVLLNLLLFLIFFFFQAEDGIRDLYVTGVQTCALPISPNPNPSNAPRRRMSSYCFRFSASPRTLFASDISLKRSAALGSFAFASG